MESNHNGNGDRNVNEAPPAEKTYHEWNAQSTYDNYSTHHPQQPPHHQPFYPSYDQQSPFPYNHHHTYHDTPNYGSLNYQTPHHTQNPPYYQQNQQPYQAPTQPIPHSASYQTHNPIIPHQPSYQAQYQTSHFPTQPQVAPYNEPTYTPPATVRHQPHYGTDYRIETAPYQRESPMQRIQQLARAKHGGQLAAQNAAAAAAVAPRRISPPTLRTPKLKKGEETVRDVLQRQYLEQKRLEQMQQQQKEQQQQSLEAGFPNAHPSSSLMSSALSTPTHSSIFDAATPLPQARLDYPSAPSTPIFTFPLVTGVRTPTPHSVSSPASAVHSAVHSPAGDQARALGPSNELLGTQVVQAGDKMFGQLKTKSLMSALQKANNIAMQTNVTVEPMSFAGLHQAATVVQSLESKEKQSLTTPPATVSRKRTFDHSSPPLKQGVREEVNEKGKKVEKVYVLLHHCNIRDPEYDPRGVIKSLDEIEKDKKREDMFNLSYSSVLCPYEMVDFRIKMPPRVATPVTSSPSSSASPSSQ